MTMASEERSKRLDKNTRRSSTRERCNNNIDSGRQLQEYICTYIHTYIYIHYFIIYSYDWIL